MKRVHALFKISISISMYINERMYSFTNISKLEIVMSVPLLLTIVNYSIVNERNMHSAQFVMSIKQPNENMLILN